MRANAKFIGQSKGFWAHVRSLSEVLGYTTTRPPPLRPRPDTRTPAEKDAAALAFSLAGTVYAPDFAAILDGMRRLQLLTNHLLEPKANPSEPDRPNESGRLLVEYFEYRADQLNNFAKSKLQTLAQAEAMYNRIKAGSPPAGRIAMNKQTGKKATASYLTNMVNLLIGSNSGGIDYEQDPKLLTTFTKDQLPVRTLARRVDGAFPAILNPVAVWEIKEYYHTRSFGSRVSGGVYETLLDGLELEEMKNEEGIDCEHLLIVDALECWWADGRSYLCRMIDSLHMGYVDEILFGKEIEDRLPVLAAEWRAKVQRQIETGRTVKMVPARPNAPVQAHLI